MDDLFGFIEDYAGVMERLGGNSSLLRKLLMKFRASYGGTRSELQALMDGSRYEEAHHLVHTIKGVSGNLGLLEVYRSAVVLDGYLKAGDYEAAGGSLEPFLINLDDILTRLE